MKQFRKMLILGCMVGFIVLQFIAESDEQTEQPEQFSLNDQLKTWELLRKFLSQIA
ncbi:hypothetical protein D3C85_1797020 [compost metagenome]